MLKRLLATSIAAAVLAAPSRSNAQPRAEARKGWDATIKELESLSVTTEITDATMRIFARDIEFVEASGRVSSSLTELERNIRNDLKKVTIKSWTYETTDFGSSGPLAYGTGLSVANFVNKSDGQPRTQRVHFLILMKQDTDKRWVIFKEFFAPVKSEAK
jgi:ketosteroid isomerase-like protein